jgi:hypothetical protein
MFSVGADVAVRSWPNVDERSWRVYSEAAAILSFYLTNPGAVETIDGIVEWRLMEEIIRRRVADTHEALRWLVERGLLTRQERPGGDSLYQLPAEKRAKAERFVTVVTAAAAPSGDQRNGE